MAIFDLDDSPGVRFDLDGGGWVAIRTMPADVSRAIAKQTDRVRVEYKRVDGKAERFEVTERNEDLHDELFWDYVIPAWDGLLDKNEQPIPCTTENKLKLIRRSRKFNTFVGECMQTLAASEEAAAEEQEKN